MPASHQHSMIGVQVWSQNMMDQTGGRNVVQIRLGEYIVYKCILGDLKQQITFGGYKYKN